MNKIKDLITEPSEENKFGILAYKLMHGIEIDGKWLKLVKNNDPKSVNDKCIYDVDYRITEDGETIGYLDIEQKQKWLSGGWPYRKTNVPLYPMGQWKRHQFDGRPTNKLLRFQEKPNMSFWVGVSLDYKRCQVLPIYNMFNFGIKTKQKTSYDEMPLPIYEVPNKFCIYCENADQFTKTIMEWYQDVYLANK